MKVISICGRVENTGIKTIPSGSCQYLCRNCSGESDPSLRNKYCMTGGVGCGDKDMLDEVLKR